MWSGGFALISALLLIYICFELAFPLGVSPSFTFLPFYFFTFNPYFTITCIDPVNLREMPSGPTAVMLAM